MAICPTSTPALKPNSDNTKASAGKPSSAKTLAKPKPCIKPKPKATSQRLCSTTGQILLAAASTTDSAIADSTNREGSDTSPNAASDKVIECAAVNEVTTHSTSRKATPKLSTPRHRRMLTTSTAGSSSESKNKIWSKPIQMCQTPSSRYLVNCFQRETFSALNCTKPLLGESTVVWVTPSRFKRSRPRCKLSSSNNKRYCKPKSPVAAGQLPVMCKTA